MARVSVPGRPKREIFEGEGPLNHAKLSAFFSRHIRNRPWLSHLDSLHGSEWSAYFTFFRNLKLAAQSQIQPTDVLQHPQLAPHYFIKLEFHKICVPNMSQVSLFPTVLHLAPNNRYMLLAWPPPPPRGTVGFLILE